MTDCRHPGRRRSDWVPLGAAVVFTYAVVASLRWWRPVIRDDRPGVAVGVVDSDRLHVVHRPRPLSYAALLDRGLALLVALLVATQFVGWGEEGMFRGIGVTTLRRTRHSPRARSHCGRASSSARCTSPTHSWRRQQALPQAIAVRFAGYFFYLMRRVRSGNVLNSVLHGLFDFSLLTGTTVIDQGAYIGSAAAIVAYIVVGTLLIVRRHRIEPPPNPHQTDRRPSTKEGPRRTRSPPPETHEPSLQNNRMSAATR